MDRETGAGTLLADFYATCLLSMTYDSDRETWFGSSRLGFTGGALSFLHTFDPRIAQSAAIVGLLPGGVAIEGMTFIPGSHDANGDGIPHECQGDSDDANFLFDTNSDGLLDGGDVDGFVQRVVGL